MAVSKVPDKLIEILIKSGHGDENIALAAQKELVTYFVQALEEPLRDGVLVGDIISDIFQEEVLAPNAVPSYELSFLAPGTEKDHVAYVIPNQGKIPQRHIEGDYVQVPTYRIASSVDWLLRYATHARWPMIQRAMEAFEVGFTKKRNDDGWHTLLMAGVDRNIVVYDTNANVGQFTKRLVSLMKLIMRRNGGGNSSSTNRRKLTDLYMSPEGQEDMRNWGIDQVDEITRREIYVAEDGSLNRVFQVNMHDIDELGAGQEYQNFFTGQLTGNLASGDVELVVGIDKTRRNFYMPVKEQMQMFPDPSLHREQREGVYGWMELGFFLPDNRDIILGSY